MRALVLFLFCILNVSNATGLSDKIKSISLPQDTIINSDHFTLRIQFSDTTNIGSVPNVSFDKSKVKTNWVDSNTLECQVAVQAKNATFTGLLNMRMSDRKGTEEKLWRAIVDMKAPSIRSFSGIKGKWIGAGPFAFICELSEPIITDTSAVVLVNGLRLSWTILDTTHIQFQGTLSSGYENDGALRIDFKGWTDRAGNTIVFDKNPNWKFDANPVFLDSSKIVFPKGNRIKTEWIDLAVNPAPSGVAKWIWAIDGKELNQSSSSLHINAGSEGEHLVSLSVLDSAQNASVKISAKYVVDRTPPALDEIDLAPEVYARPQSTELVTLVKRMGTKSTVAHYFASFNEKQWMPIELDSSGRFQIQMPRKGLNTLFILGEDEFGNRSNAKSYSLIWDADPPRTKSVSMKNDSLVGPGILSFVVEYNEDMDTARVPVAMLESIALQSKWNSQRSLLCQGTIPNSMPDGQKGIRVLNAKDLGGLVSPDSLVLKVLFDRTAPSLIEVKGAKPWIGAGEVRLSLLFSEKILARTDASIRVNGLPVQWKIVREQQIDLQGNIPNQFAGDGLLQLKIDGIVDRVGLPVNAEFANVVPHSIVDTKPPKMDGIQIQFPEGASTNKDKIRSTLSSKPVGAALLYWSMDGKNKQLSDSLKIEWSGLTEGPHDLTMYAVDSAGNQSQPISARFIVDRTPPTLAQIKLVPIISKVPQNTARILLSCRGCANNSDVSKYFVGFSEKQQSEIKLDSVKEGFVNMPTPGKNTLFISGEDVLGNRSESLRFEVEWDNQAPRIIKQSMERERVLTLGMVPFIIEYSENMDTSLVPSCRLGKIDVKTIWKNTRSLQCSFVVDSTSIEGRQDVVVLKAKDVAGNESADTLVTSLIVNRLAPQLISWKANRTSPVGLGSMQITLEFSEPIQKSSPKIDIKLGTHSPSKMTWMNDQSLLLDFAIDTTWKSGGVVLSLNGLMDLYGMDLKNVGNAVSFTLDTKPPVLSAKAIEVKRQKTGNNTWIVAVSAPKDENGISEFMCKLDSNQVLKLKDSSWTLESMADGDHRIQVRVRDGAGNLSTLVEIGFNVDTKPPQIQLFQLHSVSTGTPEFILRTNEVFADSQFTGKGVLTKRLDNQSATMSIVEKGAYSEKGSIEIQGLHDAAGNKGRDTVISYEIPADSLVVLARALVKQNKLAQAMEQYTAIKLAHPERTDLRYDMVALCRQAKDSVCEERELLDLVGLHPFEDSLYQRLTELALARGDHASARLHVISLLIAQGKAGSVVMDDFAKDSRPFFQFVEPMLQSQAQTLPLAARPFYLEAKDWEKMDRYDMALKSLETVRSLSPQNSINVDIAICHLHNGKPQDAVKVLNGLPKPISMDVVGILALAQYRSGNLDFALIGYKARSQELRNPNDLSNYGILLLLAGNGEEGIAMLKRAHLAMPKDMQIAKNYAYGLYSIDSVESAQSVFVALPDSFAQQNADVYYGRALCSFKKGKDIEGLLALQKAISSRSYYVDAIMRLSDYWFAKGNLENAKLGYQKVLGLVPDYYTARQALAGVFRAQGKLDEARKQSELAIKSKKSRNAKRQDAIVVATLRFQNLTNNKEQDWVSIGAAEAITSDMDEFSDYQMVERIHVEAAIQHLEAGSALQSEQKNTEIGKYLSAHALILGSFQCTGKTIRLDARLVDVATGKIISTGTATGSIEGIAKLERELALSLAGIAGKKEYEETSGLISASAQQKLAEAKSYLYRGDKKKAKILGDEALKIDPHVLSVMDEAVFVSEDDAKGKTLAVLPFANTSGKADDQWLSGGVQEALITDLKKIAGLYMVERSQVNKMVEEMDLGASDFVDPKQAPKIGGMLSAGVAIMGSFQTAGDQIRINARLVVVETGEVHLATEVSGNKDDVLKLEEQLAMKILEALQINVSNYEQRRIIEKDPLALKSLQQSISAETKAQPVADSVDRMQQVAEIVSHDIVGKALLVGSVVGTVVTGGLGYQFYQDKSSYDNAANFDDATRKGDRAESSLFSFLITGAVTGAAWVTTGAWYAWQKWIWKPESQENPNSKRISKDLK